MYARLLSSEHACFEDQVRVRAAPYTHITAITFPTADTLAPTNRCLNCFIDPIEDGIEPLNSLYESLLQDTETESRCCKHVTGAQVRVFMNVKASVRAQLEQQMHFVSVFMHTFIPPMFNI